MENILLFVQTAPLLAIVMIILALFLGIIFYLWSLQIFKKIELLILKMKQNVDNLEYLSQYIYETAYFKVKEDSIKQENKGEPFSEVKIAELKEVKKQIQNIIDQQDKINQKISQKLTDASLEQKEFYSSKNKIYSETFPPEEKSKYKEVSELIIVLLKDLLSEKGQVTAQELIYAVPSQYSLADIYRSLEMMKENNQIYWEDKSIHPQSLLKLS